MTYQGMVSNGVVVFEPGIVLPEGAKVSIELEPNKPAGSKQDSTDEKTKFEFEMKNGVPQLPRTEGDHPVVDLELVNRLRDESP